MELLSTNVKSKLLRNSSLLIHGTCLRSENSKIFADMSEGRIPLETCLEKDHMNTVGFKIATIFRVASPTGIAVLTINGSPHCLQLHFAVEQAVKQTRSRLRPRHFVVEKGVVREVDRHVVWLARHLADLDLLLESCGKVVPAASRGRKA
jgi:hypothetical protein